MSKFGQMIEVMETETKRGYWRPTADTFGMRLLMTRKHLGLDLREAAAKCGVHYATWSTWERGRRPQDFQAEVMKISEALGVDPMWLAFGDALDERQRRSTFTELRPAPVRPTDTRPKGRPSTVRRPSRIRRPVA